MRGVTRVVALINGYHPVIGGAERLLGAVIPYLWEHQVETHVVTRSRPGLESFEVIEGVPVHRVNAPGPKAAASLAYTVGALRLIGRLNPHVIHAHDLFATATTAAVARAVQEIPVIATSHGGGKPGDVQRLQRKLLGKSRMKLFCRAVDAFICISSEIDREFSDVGVPPNLRTFVPNGVDPLRFCMKTKEQKLEIRLRLSLPDGPTVVYSGRLFEGKRIIDLVEIWPRVRQAFPRANLVIVGDGPEEQSLKHVAGKGILFCGAVDDVAPYLQAADVFCLPSAHEGLSISLLEAMSCGLASVVTDVGGARDCVRHDISGWIVQPGDHESLYTGLTTLLADPGRRDALGRAARQRVKAEYSLPVMAERLTRLYARVRGSRPPSPAAAATG